MSPRPRSLAVLLSTVTTLLGAQRAPLAQELSPSVSPQATPAASPAHAHEGLFLRASVGLGILSASERTSSMASFDYSGTGVTFEGAIGWAAGRNLIVYGQFVCATTLGADLHYAGETVSGFDFRLCGLGPGVAYYFDPSDFYVSGALNLSKLTFSNNNALLDDPDLGIGTSLMAGKEWRIGRSVSLGAAGLLHVARMNEERYQAAMHAYSVSLLFSATAN